MQGLEGEMDTVHAAFLHGGANRLEDQEPGSFTYYHYRDRSAKFATVDTEYGEINGAYRPAEPDTYYWRVTQILFPFYHMIPGGTMGEGIKIGAYVPMDDEHHLHCGRSVRCTPASRLPASAVLRALCVDCLPLVT